MFIRKQILSFTIRSAEFLILNISAILRSISFARWENHENKHSIVDGGGRAVRRCWVNFQYRGVLLFWMCRARAYCACSRCGWGCLDIFSLFYHFSFLSPSLWGAARYRLKFCLKGPLSPKQTNKQSIVDHQKIYKNN